MGVDPLSYWVELLTVVVYDAVVFDDLFSDLVEQNAEGTVLGERRSDGTFGGFSFTDEIVNGFLEGSTRLAPAADATLRLALLHREVLLADPGPRIS